MNNILSTEEEILRIAQSRYDAQETSGQRIIPIEAFIEEEHEKAKPGYREPPTMDRMKKIIRLGTDLESGNIFTSSIARIKLFAMRVCKNK